MLRLFLIIFSLVVSLPLWGCSVDDDDRAGLIRPQQPTDAGFLPGGSGPIASDEKAASRALGLFPGGASIQGVEPRSAQGAVWRVWVRPVGGSKVWVDVDAQSQKLLGAGSLQGPHQYEFLPGDNRAPLSEVNLRGLSLVGTPVVAWTLTLRQDGVWVYRLGAADDVHFLLSLSAATLEVL